jgi:hypothetical protein
MCAKNNYLTKEWVNIQTNERERERKRDEYMILAVVEHSPLLCTLSLIESIHIYTYLYRSISKLVIEHLVLVTLTRAHMSETNIKHPGENEVKNN